ncbi:nucleoside kinase [Candidatus Haliotispira prima]|uniref:Nucleoside kinase n=1 Tax=Candidatus Haliotispira prima TaxID=3034016 RepID=A0ABY8MEA9_9SPIO|nr:nucleoside kinase [Candidatus Haliotispira prima]
MKKYGINLGGEIALQAFDTAERQLKTENDGDGPRHSPLVGAIINGELCGLNQPVSFDSELEGVYLDDPGGTSLYRNGLAFLLLQAWSSLLNNPQTDNTENQSNEQLRRAFRELGGLIIGPTMDSGFYCYFNESISEELLLSLKEQMQAWIRADLPIELRYISYATARQLYADRAEWQEYLNLSNHNRIPVYSLNGEPLLSSPQVLPVLHRCGLLETFELAKEGDGFLLRFPRRSKLPVPDSPTISAPLLLDMYRSYKRWNRNVGVNNVAALVTRTEQKNGIEKLITLSEIHQQKTTAQIADTVLQKKSVRLLLVAGPSSSGKTTFTKKLALQLEILGYQTVIVSLDDFYLGKELAPKDENGKPDLERLEALNLERLNRNLSDLLAGKEVEFPYFDFAKDRTAPKGHCLQLPDNAILLIEGIHGLNPGLIPGIPCQKKFHVYISALTQLNILPSLNMSTSDNRLLRRIVRDYQFRNHSAHATLAMWKSVQRGEQLHILPHRNKADAIFNSALEYEIPILKTYAAPLLKQIKPESETYATAKRLENILSFFPSLPSNSVPTDSILREFIGGSSFYY